MSNITVFFLFPKIEDQVSPRMSTLRPRVSQQNQNYISQYDDEDFEPVYPTPTTPRRSSIRPVDQRKIKSFYQNEEEYKVVETDCLENFGVQNRDIGGLAIGKKLFFIIYWPMKLKVNDLLNFSYSSTSWKRFI